MRDAFGGGVAVARMESSAISFHCATGLSVRGMAASADRQPTIRPQIAVQRRTGDRSSRQRFKVVTIMTGKGSSLFSNTVA
jgi:hypothetical protein